MTRLHSDSALKITWNSGTTIGHIPTLPPRCGETRGYRPVAALSLRQPSLQTHCSAADRCAVAQHGSPLYVKWGATKADDRAEPPVGRAPGAASSRVST